MAKGRSVVPHGHDNMATGFLVLKGNFRGRHYDRVEDHSDHYIIRPTIDRTFKPGEFSTISDHKDNVHWFTAESETGFIFNIHVTETNPENPRTPGAGLRRPDGREARRRPDQGPQDHLRQGQPALRLECRARSGAGIRSAGELARTLPARRNCGHCVHRRKPNSSEPTSPWTSRVWRMIKAGGIGQGTIAPTAPAVIARILLPARTALAASLDRLAQRFLVSRAGLAGRRRFAPGRHRGDRSCLRSEGLIVLVLSPCL